MAAERDRSKDAIVSDEDKKRFLGLQDVFALGKAVLVKSRRRDDGEPVALICNMKESPPGMFPKPCYRFIPYAVLIEGDPYKQFVDPMDLLGTNSTGLETFEQPGDGPEEATDAHRQ